MKDAFFCCTILIEFITKFDPMAENPARHIIRGRSVRFVELEGEALDKARTRVQKFASEFRCLLVNPQYRGREIEAMFRVAGGNDEVLRFLISSTQRTRPRYTALIESLVELVPLRCQRCDILKTLDDRLDRRMGEPVEIQPTGCPVQGCQGFLCRACSLARRRSFAVADVAVVDRQMRLAGIPRHEDIPVWRCEFHTPPQ